MTKKIMSVTSVNLEILNKKQPVLVVHAEGEVNSGGWSKGQLIPYVYVKAPADGIYDFDFAAEEPSGPSTDAITPINAKYEWTGFPENLKGVRVHASNNYMVATLPSAEKLNKQMDSGALEKVSRPEFEDLRSKSDSIAIVNAFVWEDVLHITVRYGGGCKKHDFRLVWDGSEMESNPPRINVFLFHDSHGDNCRALLTEELQFVLSPALSSRTIILLEGWDIPLRVF